MRIISKFHDFYDSLTDGADANIWTREQSTVFIDKNDLFFKRYGYGNPFPVGTRQLRDIMTRPEKETPELEAMILIFCGKIIPLWHCQNTFGYSLEALNPILAEQGLDEKKLARSYFSPLRTVKALFNGEVPPEVAGFNLKYKCPIILLREYRGDNRDLNFVMELNPCLKDLDFQRTMNIVETFQELERFIFNDLVETDNVTSTGDDKVIAACKGFGHKYAFRKEPENQK